MTIVLDLEPDLEARVVAQAQERGVPLPQYLHGIIAQAVEAPAPEHSGWPAGFFQETYGSLAADPIERLPQGSAEAREPLA